MRSAAATVLAILALGAGSYFFSLRLAEASVPDPHGHPPHGPARFCVYGHPGCLGFDPRRGLWVVPVAVVVVGLGLSATGALRRHKRVVARGVETRLDGRPLTRRPC
jgi:hypothetical protein